MMEKWRNFIACRDGDERCEEALAALNHEETRLAVVCERAFLAALDGSCRTPIAGLARKTADGKMSFKGLVAKTDGSKVLETSREGELSADSAYAMGQDAGKQLKSEAGSDFFDWLE